MLAGENNPATGMPYTYEEIATRNKQRAIEAGIDPDIYDKQQKELEGRKERPESRRKLDEAMPWFALSESLGKAQAGEGIGTTIGRGLSAFGRTSTEISDKEEARLEAIRKEGNQLALAQNAFRQAEMTGNKADMKTAQDNIKAVRMEMSKLGVESTKAQNDYAKTMAELQNRREIAAMQESGAWGRAGMERNQVTQLANMLMKDAAKDNRVMTQSEAMREAYGIMKFQGAEAATQQRDLAARLTTIDKELKEIPAFSRLPEHVQRREQLQAQKAALMGGTTASAFISSGNPNMDAIMQKYN
jgi:hypothetical protein